MYKKLMGMILGCFVGIYAYAGGKGVAPAGVPVIAVAEDADINPLYLGLGVVASFVERDPCVCNPGGSNLKDNRYGGIIRFGYDMNAYFGLEARVLKTFGNDVFSEVTHYGIFAKPQYHITAQSNLYALLGYGRTDVDYTNGIRRCSDEENGLSYGIGFEYDFGSDESYGKRYSRKFDGKGDQEQGWGIWFDVQRLINNGGTYHTDSTVVTGGITYDF